MLAEFRASRPDLEQQYQLEIARVEDERKAIAAGPYPGIGAAHLDLYQMFAWRNWQLVRQGGRAAIVLPRGALSGASLAEWRRTIVSNGSFSDVCFLENAARWAFDMEPRYTIGLTVFGKGGDHVVRWCGPFSSGEELLKGSLELVEVPSAEFST